MVAWELLEADPVGWWQFERKRALFMTHESEDRFQAELVLLNLMINVAMINTAFLGPKARLTTDGNEKQRCCC